MKFSYQWLAVAVILSVAALMVKFCPTQEPYVGEFYKEDFDSQWVKFTEKQVLDKHNGEIKVKYLYKCRNADCEYDEEGWFDKYFFYADNPDQYQSKRDEILKPDKVELSSETEMIYSNPGCFDSDRDCMIRNQYFEVYDLENDLSCGDGYSAWRDQTNDVIKCVLEGENIPRWFTSEIIKPTVPCADCDCTEINTNCSYWPDISFTETINLDGLHFQ